MKRYRRREKCCRACFAYVPAGARKCKFCGYKFKSPGRYLFDKIFRALKIDRAYAVRRAPARDESLSLFTLQEIENLLAPSNFRILMYLVLDDIILLDETSLIELGEMLSLMSES